MATQRTSPSAGRPAPPGPSASPPALRHYSRDPTGLTAQAQQTNRTLRHYAEALGGSGDPPSPPSGMIKGHPKKFGWRGEQGIYGLAAELATPLSLVDRLTARSQPDERRYSPRPVRACGRRPGPRKPTLQEPGPMSTPSWAQPVTRRSSLLGPFRVERRAQWWPSSVMAIADKRGQMSDGGPGCVSAGLRWGASKQRPAAFGRAVARPHRRPSTWRGIR
jgi:hypothetical protein